MTKDGLDIPNDRSLSIDVGDRLVTLTIQNPGKTTTGLYQVKLSNNLGDDQASLRIRISGIFVCVRWIDFF